MIESKHTEDTVQADRNVILNIQATQDRVRIVRTTSEGLGGETNSVIPSGLSTSRKLRVQVTLLVIRQRRSDISTICSQIILLKQREVRISAVKHTFLKSWGTNR